MIHSTPAARGFSLVELVVSMAIMAILVAVAFPSFESTLRANRVSTAANDLVAALALARSEAVSSTGTSGVCASAGGTACDGSWNDGWLVWRDADGDGAFDPANDPVLRATANDGKTTADGGSVQSFRYDARGRALAISDMGNAVASGAVRIQATDCGSGDSSRTVSVASTGRTNLQKGNCR